MKHSITETLALVRDTDKLCDFAVKEEYFNDPFIFKSGIAPSFLYTAVQIGNNEKEPHRDFIKKCGFDFNRARIYEIYK